MKTIHIEYFWISKQPNRSNFIFRFYRRPDWSPEGSFFLLPAGKTIKKAAIILGVKYSTAKHIVKQNRM